MIIVSVLLLLSQAFAFVENERCVRDVEERFREIPSTPTFRGKLHYGWGERLPPTFRKIKHIGLRSHVQGFSKLDEETFVFSRSSGGDASGSAGFFVLRGENRYFHPMIGTDHAGGLQVFGDVLAVAAECSSSSRCMTKPAWVDFYDMTDVAKPTFLNRLLLDGAQGEPNQLPIHARAAFVAATRMPDGRHVALVGGSRSKTAWLYVSDGSALHRGTRWKFVRFFANLDAWDGMYQNMSFVHECGTGRLYLIGMARIKLQRKLHLFRMDPDRDRVPVRVGGHDLGWTALRSCNTRGGAGIRVTRDGRLALDCAAKIGSPFRDVLRYSEYVPR